MRLPRELMGAQMVRALTKLGYSPTRQTGSHVRLTCESPGQHHITVPILTLCELAHLQLC